MRDAIEHRTAAASDVDRRDVIRWATGGVLESVDDVVISQCVDEFAETLRHRWGECSADLRGIIDGKSDAEVSAAVRGEMLSRARAFEEERRGN